MLIQENHFQLAVVLEVVHWPLLLANAGRMSGYVDLA